MPDHDVRVRIAPSPTGEVHIGTIWLAQFDWLLARQHGGTFVLRLEDTDQKRFVAGSADRVNEALAWYGFPPDESPERGGPYAPYVQSQRLDLYKKYALELVEKKLAYSCFCSTERLAKMRQEQTDRKLPPRYDKHCATLTEEEVERRLSAGEPRVIRLNVPAYGTVTHHDIVRGPVQFSLATIDDSVLLKSDGFPTYHLAVVVDDHLMKISHVIRGEEWLPSTPKHLLIYQGLGWQPPLFAHLPLILGPDKRKLSKREGAVSALAFREAGYLPEAMRNFLLLMGWHPKGESEILTLEEMIAQFRLEDINPSGAIFDRTKLDWLNGYYIRQLSLAELRDRIDLWWHRPAADAVSDAWQTMALQLVQDRLHRLGDIDDVINFAFPSVWNAEATTFDRQTLVPKKGTAESARRGLQWALAWLESRVDLAGEERLSEWQQVSSNVRAAMIAAISSAGMKNVDVLWPVRAALSLRAASPDVFDLLTLVGRDEAMRRMRTFFS